MDREFLSDYNEETEKRIILCPRNKIVKNYNQLDKLIDEALDTNKNKCLHLGKINNNIISNIKENIKNLPKNKKDFLTKNSYDLIINQSEIRHLLDEKKKLNKKDIHKYVKIVPKVIEHADYISYSKNNKNEGLRINKITSDGTYISFIIKSNKKGTLRVQSIFLKKENYENKKRSYISNE